MAYVLRCVRSAVMSSPPEAHFLLQLVVRIPLVGTVDHLPVIFCQAAAQKRYTQ